ncbi:MAG: hypothetical protein KIS78_06285 [Labilithrix sp.]|nr:hypothetical protein [Labilithrix sp.]
MSRPSRALGRAVASLVVVVAALLAARPARADATYVSFGVIASTWTDRPLGLGAEVSVMRFARSAGTGGLGAFTQLELSPPTKESDDTPFRVSVGPQMTEGPFGVEIGLDYRTGVRGESTDDSLGLRVAPFLSLGIAYVSFSGAYLPVATDVTPGGRPVGLSLGMTVGLKAPLLIQGKALAFCPHC